MDFLDLDERISLARKIGESQYREFKSALDGPPGAKQLRHPRDVKQDIARTLVAFANADGGELLLGIEDDGAVTGVPHEERIIADFMAAPNTHVHDETPLPAPRKARAIIDGKVVLYFAVPKGTRHVHITADGRCLKRMDRDSVPYSAEGITAQRLEDRSRAWDRESAAGATLGDLDLDLVNSVAGQIAYGISPEKCLQYLDLAEFTPDGLKLKNAAVVLFGKDIRRWHPRCQVSITTIIGTEQRSGENFNVGRTDVVANNILRLIDESWERLTAVLTRRTHLTEQAKFRHEFLYPQIACREALINAIAHRNYTMDGRGIEILLFHDRLEITSPGGVLSTISLEELRALKGAHESRNPLVCRVLREVGFMREMGEGVRRIFDVMRSNALAEPTLESDHSSFTVTLFHKSLYDPAVKVWLSEFDHLKLTEGQRAVLALGFNGKEFSTQDVVDRLGIVDMDKVREVLTPLRESGLLTRILTHMQANNAAKRLRLPKREVPVWKVSGTAPTRGPIVQGRGESEDAGGSAEQEVPLFVANLPYDLSKEEIYSLLSDVGEVIELRVPPGYGSANRGYAFARVAWQGAVSGLLKQLDGRSVRGRRVHVRLQQR